MFIEFLILIGFLILSGLFSGLETAYVSISDIKALALKNQKAKNGALLYHLKQNQRKILITVLIGNNLVNVGSSAFAAVTLTKMFGDAGVGIATAVMTFLILTFGEILPKTYFAKHAEKIALFFAPIIKTLQIILAPAIAFFEFLSDVFKIDNGSEKVTEDEIQAMIDVGAQDDVLHKKQHQMMQGVFEFDDTNVKEIMTPRVEIFALDQEKTIKAVMKEITVVGFSRIPIYKETVDKITGYIHIRDLLSPKNTDLKLKDIANNIEAVSSEKIIQELFSLFQRTRTHIAVVVDEFGGTAGIVTMEDILEELVGEIHDENDDNELYIKKVKKKTWKVSGDVPVSDINEEIGLLIPETGSYTAIAGYIQYKLKDLPQKGQEILDKSSKAKFTISKMTENKIDVVTINKL